MASHSPFDWHQYLRMADDMSPVDRERIGAAMDAIASLPEGQKLIQNAYALHGKCCGNLPDRRIVVHSGIYDDPAERMFSHANEGGVFLDRRDTNHLLYKDVGGNNVSMGLVSVTVHELYHKGDIQADQDSANPLYMISDIVPPSEADAVAYTDYFMAKYFNMPPRGHYRNVSYAAYSEKHPPQSQPEPAEIDCGWKGPLPHYEARTIPWGANVWRQTEAEIGALCPSGTPQLTSVEDKAYDKLP